jgi:hypothetical protein
MTMGKKYKLAKSWMTRGGRLFKEAYLKYRFFALAAMTLIGGFYAYQFYAEKQIAKEDVIDTFEEAIPSKCENGEWIVFPDLDNSGQYEKFSENARIRYLKDGDRFTDAEGRLDFSTDKEYSLFFFMDRDVRIEGYDMGKQEKYVQKIKCVGEEANKDIQNQRRKLMSYISENIDSIALEKSPNSPWKIDSFYFVNDADLYVEYESAASLGGDGPYDARLWLIRATKLERSVPVIETLAYIQEDENDPDKNILKIGEDLYRDSSNMTIYEYDEDAKQWVLQ